MFVCQNNIFVHYINTYEAADGAVEKMDLCKWLIRGLAYL